MKAFRERRATILLCTDVAARGLDVKDVTRVINYSLPRELDNYVHRIGRTARSGKSGIAMSLVTPTHRGLIVRIERMTQRKFREGKIPTRKEIGARKVARVLEAFRAQTSHAKAVELMDAPWREAIASLSHEEIAGRFLAMMYPEVFCEREEAELVRSVSKHKGHPGAESDRPSRGREERGFGRPEKRFDDRREYGAGYGNGRPERRFGERRELGAGYGQGRPEKRFDERREYGAGYGKRREDDREAPAFRGFRKDRVFAPKPSFMKPSKGNEAADRPSKKSKGFVSSI